MAATSFNEHGESVCLSAGSIDLGARDAQVFACFVAAGLVPPASLFFLAVVASYGLHSAHLHPNAMVTLAIFQHLCEGFVGSTPAWRSFATSSGPESRRGASPAR